MRKPHTFHTVRPRPQLQTLTAHACLNRRSTPRISSSIALASAVPSGSSTVTMPTAPLSTPAEREIGDVDAVASENRADRADHARLVVVHQQQHRAVERRFDLHAVEQHETRLAMHDGALDPAFAVARVAA